MGLYNFKKEYAVYEKVDNIKMLFKTIDNEEEFNKAVDNILTDISSLMDDIDNEFKSVLDDLQDSLAHEHFHSQDLNNELRNLKESYVFQDEMDEYDSLLEQNSLGYDLEDIYKQKQY